MVINHLKMNVALALALTSAMPVVNANSIYDFLTSKTTLSFLAGAVVTLGITSWYQGWFKNLSTNKPIDNPMPITCVQIATTDGDITVTTNEDPYDMSINITPATYILSDGWLKIRDLTGPHTVQLPQGKRSYQLLTNKGHITTRRTSGSMMVRTDDGNIEMTNHKGDYNYYAPNGQVKIDDRTIVNREA